MRENVIDTLKVSLPTAGALGITLADVNEWLTFVSLSIAIIYGIYKFYRDEKSR